MWYSWLLCILCMLSSTNGWKDNKRRSFPKGFLFGTASSAYQVEGAWNTDGKGENIWDRYLHNHPEVIVDGRNGDVASNSYHLYHRDVEMLRELGVNFYRFSISWPRVLPTGFINNKNEQGFDYYDNLIEELLKYEIEPMVTLYHFDLPQNLQELGGWANPMSIVWFEDYARAVFEKYANKVKYWITFNQPNSICMEGYGDTVMAPAVGAKGLGDYMCVKNVLLAHARVYRLYESEYKNKYKGSVGISIAVNWYDPLNNKTENVEAAERAREFQFGLYLNPIWSEAGDYPAVVKDIVARKSKEQGFIRLRLPPFTAEEIKLLKGSSDFIGMNHYTTFMVKQAKGLYDAPSFAADVDVQYSQGSEWKQGKSTWLRSAPYGLYKACLHLNKHYNYPTIIITEHGWSTEKGLRDQSRVETMRGYLSALLLALEDGTEVRGYTAWSLLDNVEWTAGTSQRFGLYEVDFESEEKTRTARQSALVYKHIIQTRVVDDEWLPKNLKISITRNNKVKNEL